MRPVSEIRRDGFTLQYFTEEPCETRIELRQDSLPMTAFGRQQPPLMKVANGPSEKTNWHKLEVRGLAPGLRYYYRIWNPDAKPTSRERNWGASGGYEREFAVSTQARKGGKTIIHIPVKVLLMPNVINVVSAYGERSQPAPAPPKMSEEDLAKIKREYALASRYFWVNSGMRLWVDYQIFIDDRWQRWGPEPEGATGIYKGLPQNRSYAGKDFADPGGGKFTIVDVRDITRVTESPVVEERPYSAQVEQAFPQRWNANAQRWEYYNSGGGTYGVDGFPQGIPGRSQFLGGGDTAWLATHEVHHDLESHGEFSLSNREDDRIVFNHPAPRHRTVSGGKVDEMPWSTNGRHGEHWDVMAYWDRTLTDAQWLRMYFGETLSVKDSDEDGIPDDDPRLPLDEKRFGSSPTKASTDGQMNDLDKAMLSTWAPTVLQPTWTKPDLQTRIPDPKKTDNDGDGLPDSVDPLPLYPFLPFIVDNRAEIDGHKGEWSGVPIGGDIKTKESELIFKQSHDDSAYYGLFILKKGWRRVDAILDGEGQGVYSGVGVIGLQFTKLTDQRVAGPNPGPVEVKVNLGKAPGLKWKADQNGDETTIEFSIPNRGESIWYWDRGGREIGSEVTLWNEDGRGYPMYEPYRLFYARMLEPTGQPPLPAHPPAELTLAPDVTSFHPGDKALKLSGNWTVENGVATYSGDDEGSMIVELPKARYFDIWVDVEGKSDGIVAAFAPGQKISAGDGFVGFVGGYANTSTRLRLNGTEVGDEAVRLTPDRHRIQLSRREDGVWLLLDGKPIVYSVDPSPQLQFTRFGVLAGYGGDQRIYELRIRTG